MPVAPNIVLFGESGCGKSSVVNMLSDASVAATSSSATGCTFESKPYPINIRGKQYNIFDTAGLDESNQGTVPSTEAIVQLYRLLKRLDNGLSLLVFCMRGPRIKNAAHKNWRLFHEIICQRIVPIVMIVTGLEDEEVLDEWWVSNKVSFQRFGMLPQGVACITATKGRRLRNGGWTNDEVYEESRQKVQEVLRAQCLTVPWKVPTVEWFSTVVDTWTENCGFKKCSAVREEIGPGIQKLMTSCELSEAEAKRLADKLRHV